MPREKRDFTRISGIRNPSLIVIATEGEKTEQKYFNGVKLKCKEYSSKIHIEILDPRAGGLSAPKYVLH
ncbi:MAG: RloB domain-containing protein, partial [Candidatus Heimdallarchaeota archaeon]